MTKRERTRATGIKRAVMSHVFSDDEPYIHERIVPALIEALEKYHHAAVKRAVRDTFQSASEMIDRDSESRIRDYLTTKYGVKL